MALGGAQTTIAAIATPPGPAPRGIVRLSGPEAGALTEAVLRDARPAFARAAPRGIFRARFDDSRGLQPVTLLWMPAPRSFTREDVAEFHLPGAEPLLACALARLLALGARAARPGEFTRRAFLNGRLDLSRAEGVLALTEAGNAAECAAAAQLLDGGLEERVAGIRARLVGLAALCEASLDFDESETGHVPRAELLSELGAAESALDEAHAWELGRAAPSALPRVLLVGAPNAGKSSLWNALTGGSAIVSELAGTTRDALVGEWALGRQSCLLIDGPGLEPGASGVAHRAQELFARQRPQADVVLWVVDATQAEPGPPPADARLVAWNKLDLPAAHAPHGLRPGLVVVPVSARGGSGLAALARALEGLLAPVQEHEHGGVSRLLFERHRQALARARVALEEARALLAAPAPLDLVAEALRASLWALDELSGRTTPEDVLDQIFARFCLGK
jgi:tRNA modification GTPase